MTVEQELNRLAAYLIVYGASVAATTWVELGLIDAPLHRAFDNENGRRDALERAACVHVQGAVLIYILDQYADAVRTEHSCEKEHNTQAVADTAACFNDVFRAMRVGLEGKK